MKRAAADDLIPYGGGSILNEVDGNLTLSTNRAGTAGQAARARLRAAALPDRNPHLPRHRQCRGPAGENPGPAVGLGSGGGSARRRERRPCAQVLRALAENPQAAERGLAFETQLDRNFVRRALNRLARAKPALVQQVLGKWVITKAGKEALKRGGKEDENE